MPTPKHLYRNNTAEFKTYISMDQLRFHSDIKHTLKE